MSTPYRRCFYLGSHGEQCDKWFAAVDDNKLCVIHREIITPNGHLSQNEETKVRYIDLVNDERSYCYHFLSGEAQCQSQTLIHEFRDDSEGTIFQKLDNHIAFIEKVLEDMKARLHSARAVKAEKLDELTEEERKELRKQKIEKALNPEKKVKSFKADPVGNLTKTGIDSDKAKAMLAMSDDDMDAIIAKFKLAKEGK